METDSIYNLIELLKSQLALYAEIGTILAAEKNAILNWQVQETSKFTNDKKRLTRKENILEEARITLTSRIMEEFSLEDGTLSSIIGACKNPKYAEELAGLKDQFLTVVASIKEESLALKILYSTNLKLINEMYGQRGYLPTNKYGAAPSSILPGTISAIG